MNKNFSAIKKVSAKDRRKLQELFVKNKKLAYMMKETNPLMFQIGSVSSIPITVPAFWSWNGQRADIDPIVFDMTGVSPASSGSNITMLVRSADDNLGNVIILITNIN